MFVESRRARCSELGDNKAQHRGNIIQRPMREGNQDVFCLSACFATMSLSVRGTCGPATVEDEPGKTQRFLNLEVTCRYYISIGCYSCAT
jgi:hypothetical protein